MAGKKAPHIIAFRLWRRFTLKLSLFIFFLFSISIFISPGAVAEDFCDRGITPPPLFLVGEPPMTRELAVRLLGVAPTFEPLEASAAPLLADNGDNTDNTDYGSGGAGDDGEDSQSIEDDTPTETPAGDIETTGAPDITRGPKNRMEISITFDGGGYDDNETLEILKVLRERGIKTTMFLTGRFISKYPQITRQIASDGHEVGNHTFGHPHLTEFAKEFRQKTLKGVDRGFLASELKRTEKLFKKATGSRMAPLWRAPYGEENREIRRWALEDGYVHVGWTYGKKGESLDTLDWVDDTSSRFYHSPEEIKERVLRFGRNGDGINGGIILMHLSTNRRSDRMSAMLGELIDDLTSRGYRFVKVSELLRDNRVLRAMEDRRVREMAGDKEVTAGQKSVVKAEDHKAFN